MNVILWILIGLAIYLVGVVLSLALIAYINKKYLVGCKDDISSIDALWSFIFIAFLLVVVLVGFVILLKKELLRFINKRILKRLYNWFYNKIDV